MPHILRIEPSGRSIEVSEDESVLDAALRQGIALPYGCQNGACRSCRGRIVKGELHYPAGEPKALQPIDRSAGFALLCEAHLRSDACIEVEEIDADRAIVVRTVLCRVIGKEPLCHDVVALRFKLQDGERLEFLAGQYVDVVLRDGRRRAFSLATPPGHDGAIELQIRHVPGGEFSSYVFSHIKERAILRLRGPLGSFYLRKHEERPVILMAGGTGFAPIKSIVEDALAGGYEQPMHLYWGVRAKRDLYQHELALDWAARHQQFHYVPVLSEPGDDWNGRSGFVHQAVLEDFDDLSAHATYMSGPPPMIAAGRKGCIDHGLDPGNVHSDSFDYAYETGHDEV